MRGSLLGQFRSSLQRLLPIKTILINKTNPTVLGQWD